LPIIDYFCDMNQPDITPVLDELRHHTRVGAVTLFYGSEPELGKLLKPARLIMSGLGIRACMDRVVTPFPALQGCMAMRKISLVYPDREQFVLVKIAERPDIMRYRSSSASRCLTSSPLTPSR
jgi:hypothetical protein